MGMTFLAAGTSLPEAVSSVIMTAQGHGSMGISNSIGSNIFDILLCLGLPWMIKTLLVPGRPWVSFRLNVCLFFSFRNIIPDHAQLNRYHILNNLPLHDPLRTLLRIHHQQVSARS